MNENEVRGINEAFETMVRADYISIDDLVALDKLDDYYVDAFNVVGSVLQRQDNYITGRRGAGKTTLLFKSYYECMKTICKCIKKESKFFGAKRVLPIYVDLSKCEELFGDDSTEHLLEINFVMQIIRSLRKQIELTYDNNFILKFRKENATLQDLAYIENLVINGKVVKKSRNEEVEESKSQITEENILGSLSLAGGKVDGGEKTEDSISMGTKYTLTSGIDINTFMEWIKNIKKRAEIDDIYLFIDEYSDLDEKRQLQISGLIRKLFGSKMNMYIKLGVITDRFKFDEKIIIE